MAALLLVDLEATCWERSEHRSSEMETIEIGAVRVEFPWREREYQAFVRPVAHPRLSAFCRELTTITQEEVEAAATFPGAFAHFLAWAGDPRELCFASWGEFDARQIQRDCVRHRLRYPFVAHCNLKRAVARHTGRRSTTIPAALEACGLAFEGTLHRGVDDARNLARLVRALFGDEAPRVLVADAPRISPRRALTRFLALALRHRPLDFGLRPDAQGFVALEELAAVVERHARPPADRAALEALLADPAQGRFERRGERVRARPWTTAPPPG